MSLRQGFGGRALTDRELAQIVQGNPRVYAGVAQPRVVLPALAASVTLPGVTISELPAGLTIDRVIAAMVWRKQVDSSGAVNAINGQQQVQVRADTPGIFRDAITIADDSLETAASSTEGGMMLLGDSDISVEVDGLDTYEFQWQNARVDGASLILHDVQTYLILDFI